MKYRVGAAVLLAGLLAASAVDPLKGLAQSQKPASSPPVELNQLDVSIFARAGQRLIKDPVQNPTPPQLARFAPDNLNVKSYDSVFVNSSTGCTAVVIGPRVLFTARHCTPGKTIGLEGLGTAMCTSFGDLEAAAAVPPHDDDLALCIAEQNLTAPYETLGFDPSFVAMNTQLLLTGYGPTGLNGTMAAGSSFNLGIATVTHVDLTSVPAEIETIGSQVQVSDSGGGGYFVPPGSPHRFLVAINKEKASQGVSNLSFLTPISPDHVSNLIKLWQSLASKAQGMNVDICGIAGFNTGCR
jgi:hypothetical protein